MQVKATSNISLNIPLIVVFMRSTSFGSDMSDRNISSMLIYLNQDYIFLKPIMKFSVSADCRSSFDMNFDSS